MEKENFIKSFQGLRGYAILLIFISHCNYIHNKTGGNVFNDLGCLGVSVFIMLSGYLLTMQYYGVDMSKTSVLIKKRLRKFYPLHILTLVAAIPFYMGELFNGESIKQWIAMFMNIFLIQAWAPDDSIYFSYNAVSWYLSVTIFFSLVSVLVIRFFEGLKRNDIYFIMLFIIMFQFVWCKLVQHLCCAHWLIYIFPISRCFDYIAGGGYFFVDTKASI